MLAISSSPSTSSATGPLLEIISTSALEPSVDAGVATPAPLSDCSIKTKAAIKIGIHLCLHGIRRKDPFQVIDQVPLPLAALHPFAAQPALHAMLRWDSRCGFLIRLFSIATKLG